MGRPTKYSAELREAIAKDIEDGVPAGIAAQANGIHEATHYEWQNTKPEYSERITRAKNVAIKNAVKASRGFDKDGNPIAKDHQWWLEKQAREEFGNRIEIHTVRGDALRELLAALREGLDTPTFEKVLAVLDARDSEGVPADEG